MWWRVVLSMFSDLHAFLLSALHASWWVEQAAAGFRTGANPQLKYWSIFHLKFSHVNTSQINILEVSIAMNRMRGVFPLFLATAFGVANGKDDSNYH
jgi:hypothetical protein